jgi:hypothetical protein
MVVATLLTVISRIFRCIELLIIYSSLGPSRIAAGVF